jgi:hypothetical protein
LELKGQAFCNNGRKATLAFGRVLLVALALIAPTQAVAGPAEDAGALFTRWKAAYDANDNVAIGKLYATDAILHGTRNNYEVLRFEKATSRRAQLHLLQNRAAKQAEWIAKPFHHLEVVVAFHGG